MCVDSFNFNTMRDRNINLRNLSSEIKKDKWREEVDLEEYTVNSSLFEEIKRKNLELVSRRNKVFSVKKGQSQQRSELTWKGVSAEARQAYETWKKSSNYKKKECPEVCARTLLLLVHYLNSQPEKKHKKQENSFDVFWDSPSFILKALRMCVLKRDWTNMTYFLLILLNYDKKYLPVIKKMCKIMVKLNPLIRQCGLEEQFNILLEDSSTELAIV